MEPLRMNREILKVFDLRFDPVDDTPLHIKWRNRIILIVALAILAFGLISSGDFIVKFIETDLESALYAIFQVASSFSNLYTAVITILFPDTVQNYFIKLTTMRENGKF